MGHLSVSASRVGTSAERTRAVGNQRELICRTAGAETGWPEIVK